MTIWLKVFSLDDEEKKIERGGNKLSVHTSVICRVMCGLHLSHPVDRACIRKRVTFPYSFAKQIISKAQICKKKKPNIIDAYQNAHRLIQMLHCASREKLWGWGEHYKLCQLNVTNNDLVLEWTKDIFSPHMRLKLHCWCEGAFDLAVVELRAGWKRDGGTGLEAKSICS